MSIEFEPVLQSATDVETVGPGRNALVAVALAGYGLLLDLGSNELSAQGRPLAAFCAEAGKKVMNVMSGSQ